MTKYEYDRWYIGGEWVKPAGTDTYAVVSPSNEQVVTHVPMATNADIDRAVAAARSSWESGEWRGSSPAHRAEVVTRFAALVEERVEDVAQRVTAEMGSPITMARGSQLAAAVMVRCYLEGLGRITFDEIRPGPRGSAEVRLEPVGVAATISPWNGPFFLALTKMIPALLAGCSVVAKPPIETPLTSFPLGELLAEAGLPAGVVNIVPADRHVGQYLVEHPGVDKVSFTGSTQAGRAIAGTCGQLLRPVSLELGGKSAALALDDVDIDIMVPALIMGSFYNTGQACNALTRLVVHRSRYDDVVDAMRTAMKELVVSDPFDPATQIGPLANKTQLERVQSYVEIGKSEGAVVAYGGARPADLQHGYYIEPTMFVDVRNDMRIAQEEIFGPVLSVIPFDGGDEDAVRIANDSAYGLHGAVFSADATRATDVARRIDSGTCTVNGYITNPAAPFGGVKASGIGREFGAEGIQAYLDYRTVNNPALSG